FRLLPGRQLPCQVCFQNTVDPAIPGRMFPSGLDFMTASAVMRSPAAVRAVEAQSGKAVAQAVQKAHCPPMPDTLYGRSMELLAKLQKPLPSHIPESLRNRSMGRSAIVDSIGGVVGAATYLGAVCEKRRLLLRGRG